VVSETFVSQHAFKIMQRESNSLSFS